jgi:DHA1 family tetracycline resistance protein-like MFS transporter
LSKALLPIFLIILVDILAMTIIMPLLPFYAEHLGASPTMVGLLVSTFAVCQLIGGPLLGRWSDRAGRKPLLIVSQVGTLVGFVILAYADNLWLIFLSRIIDGFTAGNITLAQAYITDITKPELRTKSFAVIGIAFGLGFLIGPGVSGFLSQYGYVYPVLAAIGLSALSIVATWVLLPATPGTSKDEGRLGILQWSAYLGYFKRPELSGLLWQFLAFIFAFTLFMSGFPLFAERQFTTQEGKPFGPREVGYIYAYVGVLGVVLQGGLIGRFVRWWGEWKLIRLGFICGAVAFAALAFTTKLVPLLIVAIGIAFTTSVVRPAVTSLITQSTLAAEQGTVLGLTQSLQSVAQIVAPLVGGFLIDHRLLSVWALLAAASAAIGLLFRKGGEKSRS